MTREEIIEMAKLAGWEMDDSCVLSPQVLWYIYQEQLEAFAKLIAAKEQDRICRQIAALHDSIMLASHATLTKRGESNEDK